MELMCTHSHNDVGFFITTIVKFDDATHKIFKDSNYSDNDGIELQEYLKIELKIFSSTRHVHMPCNI